MVFIDRIFPNSGWPGTIVTIEGGGFSTNRDDNLVLIGGEPALIITAEVETLVVLTNEKTKGGKTYVEAAGTGATGEDFTVLRYPAPDDHLVAGPPRFFHGPQHGTPKTNVQDQGVLVLFCTSPGATPTEARRTAEIGVIGQAQTYWKEASFSSTTWRMEFSGWLTLPHDHGFYYWTSADILRTRRSLLLISARPMTFDGQTLTNGSVNGWVRIGHPAPLAWEYNPGYGGDGSKTLCLRRVGNLLYAGTANGTLIVFDVTNPLSAVELGRINVGAFPIWDVDILGSSGRAIVAAGPAGTNQVIVGNPAAMTVVGGPLTVAPDGDHRTCVAANGAFFFSNAGSVLRLDHLKADGSLERIATIDGDGFITDLEWVGDLLLAPTYGKGLQLFKTSNAGAVKVSTWGAGRKIAAAKLVNNRAYLAAYGDGIVIVDCTDPAAPALLGERKLDLPVYDLEVNGNETIVAAGDSVVWSLDTSDPAHIRYNGDHLASNYEPPLKDYQDAFDLAVNSNGQAKNRNRVAIDALSAYMAATGQTLASLDTAFEGIITVHDGQVRGWSTLSPDPTFKDSGDTIAFTNRKGLITLPSGSSWTAYAHEMGHWLGMGDIYREEYADGSIVQGTAQDWCLSGDDSKGALLCGHWMNDTLKWYYSDPTDNSNVLNLAWSAAGQHDEVHEVAAHGFIQDGTPRRYHLIRLSASSGLTYYVEVRQQMPPGLNFDQNLPLPAGQKGCVLVTRVNELNSPANTFERDVQLLGVLSPGEEVVDPARNLIISVDSEIQADPLIYGVRVRWNEAIPGDPNGTFDLTITPWSTTTWESPDIWVDSPLNNNGTVPIFEFHEPNDPTRPILSGDRPRIKRTNTISARIRNSGPQKVDEAWVACYITQPPGIGDNGNWQLLENKKVTDIAGNGEKIVTFDWIPSVPKHTCISIVIQPKIGEINTENNRAQENVAIFDSGSASSHQPVILEAAVRSPYQIMKKIDVLVCGLPKGWHAVVDKEWVWLQNKGEVEVRAVIYNDIGAGGRIEEDIPRIALPRVEGWTKRHDRYEPIGGILAPVRAVKKVKFHLQLEAGGNGIYVWGSLQPSVAQVLIAVEFTHESGEQFLRHGTTDAQGHFSVKATGLRLGRYSIQALACGGGGAAQTESETLVADLH